MSATPLPRIAHHIRSFERALEGYSAKIPLARYLTAFYKEHRQMGSKDRKKVSQLLYHYFRLGQAAATLPMLQRLALAECLAGGDPAVGAYLTPEWANIWDLPLTDKIEWFEAHTSFRLEDVFPCAEAISPQLDSKALLTSSFFQPQVFIRVFQPSLPRVTAILRAQEVQFEQIGEQTFAFPNGTNLQALNLPEGSYQVQDLSSQHVLNGLTAKPKSTWWDACSGAGGKSLNLKDRFPDIKLLVSDVRPSILRNLAERFDAAGIRDYRSKVIDLTQGTEVLGNEKFDGILLDVPCTGSGTWGRTPEQLSAFTCSKIAYFSSLQRQIAGHALAHLAPNGVLCYSTCSVYTQENEAVIAFLAEHYGLTIVDMRYEIGYHRQADTLFVAHLQFKNT
jgi:16S rRNA (cytosine967-C5)-methyltransferase